MKVRLGYVTNSSSTTYVFLWRGAKEGFMDLLKAHRIHFKGVDPCLGNALAKVMELPKEMLWGCDGGQYSLYWGAVERKVSRCSFLKNELVSWDGGPSILSWWTIAPKVVDCPFALRAA